MSINNFFFSPKNYQRNNILFQQYNPNFPKLEKEILKLINYLRTNPEKYLTEFSKFFRNDFIDIIIDELNKLETKLFPFNTKKEINQAGKDYLDFMIENDIDKSYFNNNDNDKNCFHLKARLSKYGNRNGKIFESVIINSSCAEEIVNKLIKDEKARNMILSPFMKYIGINCGFLPKWNRICTIIDIVQDFIAYKDINDYSNDNTIQIINTIENDDTENMSDQKRDHNRSQNININICSETSETFKNSKMVDNKENNNNFANKTNKKKLFSIMERKKNVNHALYKNRLNTKFNKIFEEKHKLISPLATYKSDAHLIFNQINSSIKRNPTSMNRINSYIFNDINCESLAFKQFSLAGTKSQNLYDLPKKININTNNENNETNSKNKTLIENYNSNNNQNNSSKNDKNNKYITERIKGKEKNSIFHSLNELKNKLDKKKDEEKGKIGEKEKGIEGIYIEENNEVNNNNSNLKKNDDVNHINKAETVKTELTQINKDIKSNDNNNINNYNISFDNKSYSFVSKDNQNQKENSVNNDNDKDNILLTIEQINSNNNRIEENNKQRSFFSKDDIKNILTNKIKTKNQKQLTINANDNLEKDNERNKCQIDYKDISFKIDKTIEENSNSTIKEKIVENKKDISDNNNNDNDDTSDIDIDQYNYNSENMCLHKNKKEIKQLIRLYNKERIEQKNKDIANNLNSNNNNDCSTKKSTATFFYINKKNDNNSKNKDEKKIKVYKKQKINPSGSKNKIIQKKNTCYNLIHQIDKKSINLIPTVIKTKTKFQNFKIRSSENLLLTENNIYDHNSKKRLYIYNRNHSRLFKNRSYEKNVEGCKNNELIKYLNKKNIDDVEDNANKSQYFQIKRFSNCNDNLDTNVNSDNNNDVINDFIDEIKKRKEYSSNMNTNKLFYYKNKSSISKNYIYKRKPENKNFFNFYYKDINKNLIKKDKNKFDTNNNDNFSQIKDKSKYMSLQFDTSYQK